jgi:hypothetical protein
MTSRDHLLAQDHAIQSIYGVSLSLEAVLPLIDGDPAAAAAHLEQAIDTLHETIAALRVQLLELRQPQAGDDSTGDCGSPEAADAPGTPARTATGRQWHAL